MRESKLAGYLKYNHGKSRIYKMASNLSPQLQRYSQNKLDSFFLVEVDASIRISGCIFRELCTNAN